MSSFASSKSLAFRRALALLLILVAGVSQGCSPIAMLGYLIAGPPSIEPEFETETGLSMEGGEKKVAVVCYAPKNLLIEFPKIDDEVASQVAYRLGENKIAIIRPEYIRAWVDEHPDWELAEEIGKEFKADYVVQIELAAFSLYEGDSTTLYRGRTEAYVKVCAMEDDKRTGEQVFTKDIDFIFPSAVPRSSYDTTQTRFKREYISRLSEKIGWLFYEHFNGDTIPWAT
jgi:hypothetical protein